MKRGIITYWAAPDEEEVFLGFLRTTGNVVAFPSEWKESQDAVIPCDLDKFLRQSNPAQLMIALDDAFLQVESHDFDGRIRYNVTAERSAVITYRRGRLSNGLLGQSNLAFYYDIALRPPEADKALSEWGKKILGWVKDRTSERDETGKYRMSVQAQRGVRAGNWALGF